MADNQIQSRTDLCGIQKPKITKGKFPCFYNPVLKDRFAIPFIVHGFTITVKDEYCSYLNINAIICHFNIKLYKVLLNQTKSYRTEIVL